MLELFSLLVSISGASIPTGLLATPVSAVQINLKWDEHELYMYNIYRDGHVVGLSQDAYFEMRCLQPDTVYAIQLQAISNTGYFSRLSPIVKARTLPGKEQECGD